MKVITDYIKKQDNLRFLSTWMTLAIMMSIFIISQLLTFTALKNNNAEQLPEKMEVRELIKLRYTPPVKNVSPRKLILQPEKVEFKNNSVPEKVLPLTKTSFNAASLAQGFDMSRLISQEAKAARRGGSNNSDPAVAGISTEVNRSGRTLDNYDLTGVLENRNASFSAGRRSSIGGANGPRVGIGGTSSFGSGTGSGGEGLALTGRGTARASRGSGIGNGTGRATISLPSGSGGATAALDIHALIKWMKAHPGLIPKLVAYDMRHQSDDLSSALSFTMNGTNYTLFLSCNETELLLRICLVQGNDFTLLKDQGIREESNFLIIGDVVRNADKIQSLISSRQAPGERAAAFYQIFWSWWLQLPESRG